MLEGVSSPSPSPSLRPVTPYGSAQRPRSESPVTGSSSDQGQHLPAQDSGTPYGSAQRAGSESTVRGIERRSSYQPVTPYGSPPSSRASSEVLVMGRLFLSSGQNAQGQAHLEGRHQNSSSPIQPTRLPRRPDFNTSPNSPSKPVCLKFSLLLLGLATVTCPPMGLIIAMLSATRLTSTTYDKYKECEGLTGNNGQLRADLVSNEGRQLTSNEGRQLTSILLSQHETNVTVGPSMEGIYDELKTSRPLTHIVLLAWNMLPLAALCFQSQLSSQLPLNNVERSLCGHVDNCAESKQKQWSGFVSYLTLVHLVVNKVVLSCCNKPLKFSFSLWLTRHARVGPEPTVPSHSPKHIKRNLELLRSYNTLSITLVFLLAYAIALFEYEKKQAFVDANQNRKYLVPDLTGREFNQTLAELYGQSHEQGVALLPSWITQELPYPLQLALNWWMPNDHARKLDLFGSPTIATPDNHYGMVGIWLTLHFFTIYGELLNVSNSATKYLQYHQQNGGMV